MSTINNNLKRNNQKLPNYKFKMEVYKFEFIYQLIIDTI